jgi:hypothetical protein
MKTKLDYKKWKADLDVALENKDAKQITWLHVLRACITGKKHCDRKRLDWYVIGQWGKLPWDEATIIGQNGGTAIVPLTRQDHVVWAGDAWKKYLMEVKEPSLLERFRRILRGT